MLNEYNAGIYTKEPSLASRHRMYKIEVRYATSSSQTAPNPGGLLAPLSGPGSGDR